MVLYTVFFGMNAGCQKFPFAKFANLGGTIRSVDTTCCKTEMMEKKEIKCDFCLICDVLSQ